ncbi:MAG TPA: N-acetylneuraminate synthase family protein [Planctomycetota bacterium]|nr:N-acetylneuraminate synthase family protein [Planctomycetota bacterium]
MKTISVGDRRIGAGQPVFIIAEAGSNHNRSLPKARALIDTAARAGADAVKFQTYSGRTLYSRYTPGISYLRRQKLIRKGETVQDLLTRIELPREWQKRLADHCRRRKVLFLSTPFDLPAVDELDALGVPAFKIASFEINHIPLIEHAASKGKPLLVSTGMCDLKDIRLALAAAKRGGNPPVALFHCAIAYPPRYEDINLRAMETMRRAFRLPVGFSDHTMGPALPAAAVALGACMIEKHFTLSRKMKGPDHPFSLEPDELAAMVRAIRETEQALGSPEKRRTAAEDELYLKARRGLVAARAISRGERITSEMLEVKRPGFGISPVDMAKVVGRRAGLNLREDEILRWEMLT